jgi:hypothetical protein
MLMSDLSSFHSAPPSFSLVLIYYKIFMNN